MFWAILTLPGEACALVNYGAQVTHQSSEAVSGGNSNTTTQDKLSLYYNVSGRPSSAISMQGKIGFDILKNSRAASESLQVQPFVNLQLRGKGVGFGAGYREIVRDDTVTSGNITRNLSSDSKDIYFDTSLNAGRLPTLRARYNVRESSQASDGSPAADSSTNQLTLGTNYKIGILALNADYLAQSGEDRITGLSTDSSNFTGQAAMTKAFGRNLTLSLRENYSYSDSAGAGSADARKSTSTTEARVNLKVLKRGVITSIYIHRVLKDLLRPDAASTENTWNTAGSYTFPKYVKLYGTYSTREMEAGRTLVTSDTKLAGLTFKHGAGRLDVAARYEKRINTSGRTAPAGSSGAETTRDSFDWLANLRLAKYLNVSLSEAYVLNGTAAGETSSDQYRLKVSMGPVKNLVVTPYMDYTVTTGVTGMEATTTVLTVPMSYRATLHESLDLNITDNYSWRGSGGVLTTPTSKSNNLALRLTLRRPLPGTTLSGDAAFTSTSTGNGPVTTTSAYSITGTWSKDPHTLSWNVRYQTGSNTADSTSYGLQYGANLKLRRLTLGFQARYSYSVTQSTTESTSQTVYMVLNMKK